MLETVLQFPKLKIKGGKFDKRPGQPKVLLRHCRNFIMIIVSRGKILIYVYLFDIL